MLRVPTTANWLWNAWAMTRGTSGSTRHACVWLRTVGFGRRASTHRIRPARTTAPCTSTSTWQGRRSQSAWSTARGSATCSGGSVRQQLGPPALPARMAATQATSSQVCPSSLTLFCPPTCASTRKRAVSKTRSLTGPHPPCARGPNHVTMTGRAAWVRENLPPSCRRSWPCERASCIRPS